MDLLSRLRSVERLDKEECDAFTREAMLDAAEEIEKAQKAALHAQEHAIRMGNEALALQAVIRNAYESWQARAWTELGDTLRKGMRAADSADDGLSR